MMTISAHIYIIAIAPNTIFSKISLIYPEIIIHTPIFVCFVSLKLKLASNPTNRKVKLDFQNCGRVTTTWAI